MSTTSPILASLAFALLAAGVSGAIAARFGQSVILGYIVAGVLVGPYTPGFEADSGTVDALAEIGVILLLFATGTEVSVRQMAQAGRVAAGGAVLQVLALLSLGYLAGIGIGWDHQAALVLGAVVAISSTAVLSKILTDRGEMESPYARLALSWAAVQDLATVVLVVMLTDIAHEDENIFRALAIDTGKAALFLLILFPLGGRVLPAAFSQIRAIRQREIFVLAAVALALMTAWSASYFSLSPALGAFLAGVVLGESDLRHELVNGLGTLRDVFVGLFFVSIGMLVDPQFLLSEAGLVLLLAFLIVVVKGLLTALIALAFRSPIRTSIFTAVALAQSGEFSFLLASVSAGLGLIDEMQFSGLVAASTVSVILAPALFLIASPVAYRLEQWRHADLRRETPSDLARQLSGHAVICGHGRVGRVVADALREHGVPVVVIDQHLREVRALRERGVTAFLGSVDNEILLERAGIARAGLLVAAVPDRSAVRRLVRYALQENPPIRIVARTHALAERDHLERMGVEEAVVGELELAVEMTRYALRTFSVQQETREDYLDQVRHLEARTPLS